MTVRVTVKDHGAKRARELLKRPRKELWIGVLHEQGSQSHPSGTTIGQIAYWMEFGFDAPNGKFIWPRSWLRDWLDENEKRIGRQLAADTARVLFGIPPESESKALSKRGGVFRREIQQRIISVPSNWAKLSDVTIKNKGHDAPLIETTTFGNAIRYKVK